MLKTGLVFPFWLSRSVQDSAPGIFKDLCGPLQLRHSGLEFTLCLCLHVSQEIGAFLGYSARVQMIKRAKKILFAMGHKFISDA
jgi:hypothetical protein